MSFDNNQKKGLLEAAASKLISRDQLLNENLNIKELNLYQREVASIATFISLKALCQIVQIISFNKYMNKYFVENPVKFATQALKDEPFIRHKLKFV